MPYQLLTEDKVVPFLASRPELGRIFTSFANLEVKEIGDGNLNFVYFVTDRGDPRRTVVMKQAVPYVRVVGESWPLTLERTRIEVLALRRQREICPRMVPEVYLYDPEMCVVVMQNLDRHKVVRGEIIRGVRFPRLVDDLTTFLARTLFYTSDFYLDGATKKQMVGEFLSPELCRITEDLVFTDPFEENPTNSPNPALTAAELAALRADAPLKRAAAEMKHKFMTQAEALLHGDFHLGSYMANQEETFIIDPEFAFVGPMGFDVGKAIGNLLLAYLSQDYHRCQAGQDPRAFQAWLLDSAAAVWTGFARKFETLWAEHMDRHDAAYWAFADGERAAAAWRAAFLDRVFHDALGYAGCVMVRRTLGLAKVADIAVIPELDQRAALDRKALAIARRLLVERDRLGSIEDAMAVVAAVAPCR
jgi:5-methylthioribose kinase